MPSPQDLDDRVLYTGHSCSGGSPDSETMAGILVLGSPDAAENRANLLHKPRLGNHLPIRIQEEGPFPVPPEPDVIDDGRNWT